MNKIIINLALKKEVTDSMLASELYEVCDRQHSSCNNECPVYKINGSKIPDTAGDFKTNRGCDCFKSGSKMLEFIRKHSK